MTQRLVVAVPGPVDTPVGTGADLAAEVLADRLFGLGATAVAEVDLDGRPHLVADLPAEAVATLAGPHRVLEPDRSWTDGWRDHARAWTAGPFLVRPPWVPRPPTPPGTVELVVDPGGAFGSGSHPSTRGCLVALADLVRPGDRVLDVGCGSGVLGLAALSVGAGSLVAVDVDPEAVRVTRAVLAAGGVVDRARVLGRPVAEVAGDFDVVLANLLVPVIEEIGTELARHVAPGGHLVLGGLLPDHRERALAAVHPLAPCRDSTDDGWLTLVVAPVFRPRHGRVKGV